MQNCKAMPWSAWAYPHGDSSTNGRSGSWSDLRHKMTQKTSKNLDPKQQTSFWTVPNLGIWGLWQQNRPRWQTSAAQQARAPKQSLLLAKLQIPSKRWWLIFTYMYIYRYILYIHIYIYTYIHIYIYTYIHIYIYTYIHIYIYTYIHIYIYTYIHTYIHVYNYIKCYMYIYKHMFNYIWVCLNILKIE